MLVCMCSGVWRVPLSLAEVRTMLLCSTTNLRLCVFEGALRMPLICSFLLCCSSVARRPSRRCSLPSRLVFYAPKPTYHYIEYHLKRVLKRTLLTGVSRIALRRPCAPSDVCWQVGNKIRFYVTFMYYTEASLLQNQTFRIALFFTRHVGAHCSDNSTNLNGTFFTILCRYTCRRSQAAPGHHHLCHRHRPWSWAFTA